MTTRMEDLIDYCRNAGHDEGFFIRLGSHAPWIGVWRIGGDDDGFFAIDDWFGRRDEGYPADRIFYQGETDLPEELGKLLVRGPKCRE